MSQLSLFGESTKAGTILPAETPSSVHALATQMPPNIRFGTSSWTYPGWQNIVYGKKYTHKQLANLGLLAYAAHPLLTTVGIDRSLYQPVDIATYQSYCASVPDNFSFVSKAHEHITHKRFPKHSRYGDLAGTNNPTFLDSSYAKQEVILPFWEAAGKKAGIILFQFSPQDLRQFGGANSFAKILHSFLQDLPPVVRYAVEIRNPEILTNTYTEALLDTGTTHCINLMPTMPSIAVQRQKTKGAKQPCVLIRWMLAPGYDYETARQEFSPFSKLQAHDRNTRAEIATLLTNESPNKPCYVLISNKAEGCAPASVTALAEEIVHRHLPNAV